MTQSLFISRWLAAAAVIVIVAAFSTSAAGQPLKRGQLPFGPKRTAPASTSEDYLLTQESGPWLIICTSFSGDDAMERARELCDELKTSHKMTPYIYRQQFDYSQPIAGIMPSSEPFIDAQGRAHVKPRMMRANVRRQEEVAVLVGDFPTLEDHRAQQVLETVKHLHPNALKGPDIDEDLPLGDYRRRQQTETNNRDLAGKGPMRAAFLLANPLLPDEYFDAINVDHFIINLNRRIDHSLLKADGVYTVRVATFRGDATFDLSKMEEIEREQSWRMKNGKGLESSKLVEATVKASLLTKELRKLGVEAYEFHDRTESVVCVGAFEWWMKQDEAGNSIYNPEMLKTIESFQGRNEKLPDGTTVFMPRSIASLGNQGLFFDVEPKAMAVPRATASTRTVLFR